MSRQRRRQHRSGVSRSGETAFGRRRSELPRGTFCGMGVCYDCLVTVNSRRGQRACMTTVSDGMSVRSEHERRLADETVPPRPGPVQTLKTEIAVIGAGPAGLSAALRAATAGADVVVLDERGEPGGNISNRALAAIAGALGLIASTAVATACVLAP